MMGVFSSIWFFAWISNILTLWGYEQSDIVEWSCQCLTFEFEQLQPGLGVVCLGVSVVLVTICMDASVSFPTFTVVGWGTVDVVSLSYFKNDGSGTFF